MAIDLDFVLTAGDGIASVAPEGTALPADMSALAGPYADLGALSTDGLAEAMSETRTSFKRWGSTAPFRSKITDQEKTFDVTFLESNPAVLGLYYKVDNPVASGPGTNEVQTVTITGGPTGGTFSLTFGNHSTTALAFNATAAAVQAALEALPGIGAGNVTVAGAAGGPYTVTFQGALAAQNVDALTATSTLTGGVAPGVNVVTATPGANGGILSLNDSTDGDQDLRVIVFDLIEGTNHLRFACPKAEVTARKGVTYKMDGLVEYGVTITAYVDDSGIAVARMYLLDAVNG